MNSQGRRHQQCAPCKQQGRRCDERCGLAPYFPTSYYAEYVSAHRLFGLTNINKIMNAVQPSERKVAAESILSQASARAVDPVHGCVGVVRRLQEGIARCERELEVVNQHLEHYRRHGEGKIMHRTEVDQSSDQASLEEGGRVESFNIDRTVSYASEDPSPAGASTGESEGEGEASDEASAAGDARPKSNSERDIIEIIEAGE